ncbi:MAG: hypothetical protein LBJ14_02820 [Desulfarculales bacterium]|jgi:flavodoxin|nr:hypothetical protein [Desulfarculales bacterium]
MKRILIAYYSHSGATRRVAEHIKESTGGDIYEIQELEPYPRDYSAVVNQAKKEIAAGHKPSLNGELPDAADYDVIFIGSPNWWSTIAPPAATFLSSLDLTGKRIIPFITHGGGGLGRTISDIKKLCQAAAVDDGLDATRSERIPEFVKSLNLK